MVSLQRNAEWRLRAIRYGFISRGVRSGLARLIPAGLAALVLAVLAYGGTARANTITVSSLVDPGTASTCALRDAITAANTKAKVHGCRAGNGTDTIEFASGLSGTITLGTTLPAIINTLTIQGTATSPPAITVSGGGLIQLLVVNAGAALNLNNLTLTDGNNANGNGGGIDNEGTLNVDNSTISGNNDADFAGGGIFNDTNATLTVVNSTISGNSATSAGGIDNAGTLTVVNSTFSGNSVLDSGGGISNSGTITVVNSTFAGNDAGLDGGGISNDNAANLEGTILASSTGGNCSGNAITDNGYNLSDDDSCIFSGTGSDNNVTTLDLGTLQNNGGPTQTIALGDASTALNAIPAASCLYANVNPCTNPPASSASGALVCDQRGVQRPQGTGCDIGAFELQATTDFESFETGLIVFPSQFAAGGSFSLAADAPAINPPTQSVTVTISSASFGPLSVTIPAGSFTLVKGQYEYSGTIGGIKYGASISGPVSGVYDFTFFAFGLDVDGITNPVTLTFQIGGIGANTGSDTIEAAIL